MKRSAILCLALSLAFQVSSASAVTQYNLTRLGAFGSYPVSGGAASYAYAVNDLGSVAGNVASTGGQGTQAFFWKAGIMTGLGMLERDCTTGGCRSYAYGINDADVVVGQSDYSGLYPEPSGQMAFRWEAATSTMTGLGWINPAYGCNSSVAYGINNLGRVVGWDGIYVGNACALTDVHATAFIYYNPLMVSLSGIDTGTNIYSQAAAINRDGAVVGRGENPFNPAQNEAFVWTSGGGPVWIGYFPSSGAGHTSFAYGINDSMDVVGRSTSPRTTAYEAFIWSSASGMVPLGDLAGGLYASQAYGINNSRQVVGTSQSSYGYEAFLWDSVNGMVSLNSLVVGASGWWLTEARDINNNGQIVGWGMNPSGGTEAFLLTPAPVSAPLIAFSPASLTFTAGAGGVNPANKTLNISNSQTGTLNWAVSPGDSWLTLNPTSGSQTGAVTVSVNISGLTPGTYATNVSITGNAANSPQTVSVTLTVTPPPTIGYSPSSLSYSVPAGSTGTQKLGITNSGVGSMFWTTARNQTWISIVPPSGVATSGVYTYADVTVNSANLAEGTHSGNITINALGATNTPQSVPVSMTIPQQIVITYPNGGETLRYSQNVTVTWNVNTAQAVSKTDTSYSLNGGTTWKLIKSQKGLASNCPWRVPSLKAANNNCLVKVEFKNAAGAVIGQDRSNAAFTITK